MNGFLFYCMKMIFYGAPVNRAQELIWIDVSSEKKKANSQISGSAGSFIVEHEVGKPLLPRWAGVKE